MKAFSKSLEIRWSDLDPNFHVLHSKYYDFGAYCRMAFMVEAGITPELMQSLHIGPILLQERCQFRKELRFGDQVHVSFAIDSAQPNYSRFSVSHEIYKNPDILSARIWVDFAWMDTQKRKLTTPPDTMIAMLQSLPHLPAQENKADGL